MQINTNVRNAAVILLIAAVIYALGTTGDFALNFLVTFISLAFMASIAWILSRLYQEHRVELYSLGTKRRAIVYIALGVGAVALTALSRFWHTGFGAVVFLVLLGCCIYALFAVWRSSREY